MPRWSCPVRRSRPRRAVLLLLGAIIAARPAVAGAWGADGHLIVAEIAEARLTPAARALVREVAGALSLSAPEIATWADAQRDPSTRPWHYVNIPFSAGRYLPDRDCPRGACAVAAISRAEATLAAREGGALARADALRWLVHLVADLHQPMHAGDGRDRGGNDLAVRLRQRRQPLNLHRVWDVEVVAPLLRRSSPAAVARALLAGVAPAQADAWAAEADPAVWAEASSRVAQAIYADLGRSPADGQLRTLTPWDYERAQRGRVAVALLQAGIRLGEALNRAARARAGE